MKKTGTVLLLLTIVFLVSGQELTKEKTGEKQITAVSDSNASVKVVIGKDLLSVEDSKDTVKVRVGNRGINVLESLEDPKYKFEKYSFTEDSHHKDKEVPDTSRAGKRRSFKGHWFGIEFGFNNLLTAGKSMVMPDDINYMTLHSGKSNNFNLNFPQLSLGITKHFGIVTGLGLNWNNYRFSGYNNIKKGPTGEIGILDTTALLEKSKLTTVYLMVPAIFELQIPSNNHHLNIAAGLIGAIKLGSHTKMEFQDGNKVKSYDDFSLNLLRCGATARIGYANFQLYGTYYLNPLFNSHKGPGGYDLYPFEIGFAFAFND
jgi:hypothetical protein